MISTYRMKPRRCEEEGTQDIRGFMGVGETDGEGEGSGKGKERASAGKGKERVGTSGKRKRGVKGFVEEEEGDVEGELEGSAKPSTRNMGQFPLEQYTDFIEYLTSIAGGRKSEKNSRGITTNVSKYHFFCGSTFDELHSLHYKEVLQFVNYLDEKIGPSGIQQKILDIETHIKYLMIKYEETKDEESICARSLSTLKKLCTLRKSFRARKTRKEREGLEDLAGDLPELTPVTNFLKCQLLTKEFHKAIEVLKDPARPKREIRKYYYLAMAILAGRLMYR